MNRILICGDRNWKDYEVIDSLVKSLPLDSIIIQGMCSGADSMGKKAGEKYGFEVLDFPAKWEEYGNSAGPIRNTQMLDEGKPNTVYAFHNDIFNSRGTKNMIIQALNRSIPVIIIPSTENTIG